MTPKKNNQEYDEEIEIDNLKENKAAETTVKEAAEAAAADVAKTAIEAGANAAKDAIKK